MRSPLARVLVSAPGSLPGGIGHGREIPGRGIVNLCPYKRAVIFRPKSSALVPAASGQNPNLVKALLKKAGNIVTDYQRALVQLRHGRGKNGVRYRLAVNIGLVITKGINVKKNRTLGGAAIFKSLSKHRSAALPGYGPNVLSTHLLRSNYSNSKTLGLTPGRSLAVLFPNPYPPVINATRSQRRAHIGNHYLLVGIKSSALPKVCLSAGQSLKGTGHLNLESQLRKALFAAQLPTKVRLAGVYCQRLPEALALKVIYLGGLGAGGKD